MSECEIPVFFEHSEPIARKPYKCCECGGTIAVGEKHFRGWGKWPDGFSTYRQHTLCMDACILVRDELNDGECIGFGELFEFWSEMRHHAGAERGDDTPTDKLRKMMVRIRWRLRAG